MGSSAECYGLLRSVDHVQTLLYPVSDRYVVVRDRAGAAGLSESPDRWAVVDLCDLETVALFYPSSSNAHRKAAKLCLRLNQGKREDES